MQKIKLGAHPYIYPMPTVIVGTVIKNQPNFTTVSYVGIVQHKPPMVSVTLVKKHHSNTGIKESKSFSINIPNTKMLRETDFIGMNSGTSVDKSSLFSIFYGNLKSAPMIVETPLNLECKLVDVVNLNNDSDIFIGKIVETYSTKKYIRKGYPYMKKLDPILFSINSNSYYNVGRRIGRAWKSGLKIKVKRNNGID
ncbi:MAG: flavin reductase family protein [Bacteroidales bacterium]|jgi:flavin reductase (DIM6/NTAB) family NADH-FMN oxidoreductase RutF